jgi:hypothetical protein
VLFNLGQAYYQVHDYTAASRTLAQYLKDGATRVDSSDRALVESELGELAQKVGRLRVTSNVDGATVTLDDRPVGTTPLTDAVDVNAGVHRVTAKRDGTPAVDRSVEVAGGESVDVALDFAPLGTAPAALPVLRPSSALVPNGSAEARPNRTPAIAALALGGAGLAVGAAFGAIVLHDKSVLGSTCDSERSCPSSAQPRIADLSRSAVLSEIGFAVAALGAVAGVAMWATGWPSSAPLPERTSIRLTVGPATAAIAGRF